MYKIMLKKRFAATIFIITILVAYTPKRNVPNFSGKWHAETSSMSFDLSIYQKENVLSGSHCSVMNNGDKIDCVVTVAIVGRLTNNSYTARVYALYKYT